MIGLQFVCTLIKVNFIDSVEDEKTLKANKKKIVGNAISHSAMSS